METSGNRSSGDALWKSRISRMSSCLSKPKARARPVDQGEAGICTLAAIANAVVDGAMEESMDFNLDEVIGALKQLNFVDVKDGNNVEEFHGATLRRITDSKTGTPYNATLEITPYSLENNEDLRRICDRNVSCVLVYNLPQGFGLHTVFIREVRDIKGIDNFVCINSWGRHNPNPNVEVGQEGNKIYEVKAYYERLHCGNGTIFSDICINEDIQAINLGGEIKQHYFNAQIKSLAASGNILYLLQLGFIYITVLGVAACSDLHYYVIILLLCYCYVDNIIKGWAEAQNQKLSG